MSNIFIISGMSGSGHDSVIDGLKKKIDFEKIVTSTTRKMRSEDKDGVTYNFISKEEFEQKISKDEMAEYAQEYNDNFYGVTKDEIERVRNCGKIGIWKIEYKGVITAKKKFPEIKSIHITAASFEILKKRILKRNPDFSKKLLEERMEYNKEWIKHKDIYDYTVINEEGKLEQAVDEVAEIIKKNLK